MAKKNTGDDFFEDGDDTRELKKFDIKNLQSNIDNLLDSIKPIDQMIPDRQQMNALQLDIESHDYDRDIELIKIDASETLECLSNLYLTKAQMKSKNVNNVIKYDASLLSKLNFSMQCAERALIICMKQLDMGIADPEMYKAVSMFQKEMRDTVKQAQEILRKMKDFYKELKDEYSQIDAGNKILEEESAPKKIGQNITIIGDNKALNDIIEQKMNGDKFLETGKK